jgi:hypothetical protein
MEIFLFYETRKNGGNKNRVFSTRGGSCTPVFSWGSGTHSCSHPWVTLPQENTLIWEPPLQQYSNSTLSFMQSMTKLLHSSNSKIQNLNTYPQFIMGDNSPCWKPCNQWKNSAFFFFFRVLREGWSIFFFLFPLCSHQNSHFVPLDVPNSTSVFIPYWLAVVQLPHI